MAASDEINVDCETGWRLLVGDTTSTWIEYKVTLVAR